ncbi:hypothetical protein LP420_33430 [Massilia sp. B-10]|nr:hypothetical protein LP420_33430 [Massilia sp. B-10]
MMNTVKNLSKQFSWLPVALIALALFVHAQMQPRFDVKNISIEEAKRTDRQRRRRGRCARQGSV